MDSVTLLTIVIAVVGAACLLTPSDFSLKSLAVPSMKREPRSLEANKERPTLREVRSVRLLLEERGAKEETLDDVDAAILALVLEGVDK